MFIVGILSWWYSAGLWARIVAIRERLASVNDYFSIGLLLRTLIAPFRQISAGKVNGPIGVKWRAFVDRLVSRVIGAIVRSLTIVIGIAAIIISAIYGCIIVLGWALVPLAPLIGLILTIVGWVPTWK